MPSISLSCLRALARIFSAILNSNGEKRHPDLVPGLRKMFSNTLPQVQCFAVDFTHMEFFKLR